MNRDLFGNPIRDEPKRKTDNTASDRVAKQVAMRSEIGALPAVANPERKTKCEASLVEFGICYCSASGNKWGLLIRPPSEMIIAYVNDLQNAIENSGLVHVRFPRGGGKTTWIKIGIAWAVSYGYLRFPICGAATAQLAQEILNDIWKIFELSLEYGEDFPEVAVPVRALCGMPQRAAGQTYDGERTAIRRTQSQITLPTIPGAKSSGAIIAARGASSAVRGMANGSQRPDFALLDDIQTREDATSAITTAKLISWVMGDVLGLGGSTLLAACLTSTPICANDLSEQFADENLFPSWRTISYAMVQHWPDNTELWDVYLELCRDARRTGDYANSEALQFYADNRAEMDAGAAVLDPLNYDAGKELSAIQHVYNLIFQSNKKAFEAEYQLTPPKSAQVMSITAHEVASRLNGAPRYTLPRGTLKAVGFIDVMSDAGLHYCVTAFGPQQTAAVIDYGVYPESGKLIPPNATEREIEQRLAAGLGVVIDRMLAANYSRADGNKARIAAIWMDHGWMTKVVVRLAALYRSRGIENIYTCKGFSSDRYADGTGKNVIARAFNVDFREREGVQFAAQNSDYWKECTQRAFRGTPLQPGSISLWGKSAAEHADFSEQIAAEVLTDKATSARGMDMYKWTLRVGAKNHFLDTVSGTLAMAGWYRYWESSEIVDAAVSASNIAPRAVAAKRKKFKVRSALSR